MKTTAVDIPDDARERAVFDTEIAALRAQPEQALQCTVALPARLDADGCKRRINAVLASIRYAARKQQVKVRTRVTRRPSSAVVTFWLAS